MGYFSTFFSEKRFTNFPFFKDNFPKFHGIFFFTLKITKIIQKLYKVSRNLDIVLKKTVQHFIVANLIICKIHQVFYTLKKLWILNIFPDENLEEIMKMVSYFPQLVDEETNDEIFLPVTKE